MIQAEHGWVLQRQPEIADRVVEWAEPGNFILSRREMLFRADSAEGPFRRLSRYPTPRWRRHLTRLRPVQRLLRQMFYNVQPLADGTLFLTFGKTVGVLEGDRIRVLGGMPRPASVLRSASAIARNGDVYFGEYLPNKDRGPVRIYRYRPGASSVETVHTFPAGSIRHVHGIYQDPFSDRLWCTTGDIGNEARIMFTTDGFASLETLGGGDESWRCVSLQFTEQAIYYGMDAEFERNRLFRVDRTTNQRRELGQLDGPVYYSCALGRDLFFAVTAELCPSQLGRHATLWHVAPDDSVGRALTVSKDMLSVRYFMPGLFCFPRGPGLSKKIYLHFQGLRGTDNQTFCLRHDSGISA